MPKMLIVDDERGSREALRLVFSPDYAVLLAATAEEAHTLLGRESVDVLLLDMILPGASGLDVLKQARAHHPGIPVIMVSASTAIPAVVEAMRLGALDFVSKPFDVEALRHAVRRAMETQRLHRQVEVLAQEVSHAFPTQEIVGSSPSFVAALAQLRQAAATDATVLIRGESGTGKELAARLLHSLSSRREEPFVAVHCAALPENLLESELFGHEKGAFTSADRQKPGRFDLAGAGTLFFDEVGEMTLGMQVKLLRVLQEREFMRVGGTRLVRTNARIVSATARDLRGDADQGRFRNDLFYRLSVVPVTLPPLRDRRDDIPLLVEHFVARLSPLVHAVARRMDAAAMIRLCDYHWPGNVRELRNVVERVLVLHSRTEVITPELLPEEFHAAGPAVVPQLLPLPASAPAIAETQNLEEAAKACERRLIIDALRRANGVQTRAAVLLGTTRRILNYKMTKLRIPADAGTGPSHS